MRPSRLRITTGGGSGFKSGWAIGSNSIIGVYAMKKNVASQVIGAAMVSATDGSAFTGSVTVYVTGNGGTQAVGSVGSGACTHEGNGFHTYAPAQAETNYDHIGFTFIGTGAVPATVQVFPTFPQTGDSFARIGAPTGASISADLVTIDTVVDSILVDTAEIGAAGAGLTNIGTIATVTNLTNMPSIPANWITAAGIATDAIDGDAIAASAVTEIQSGLSTLTASAAADAVWDEVISGHLTAGTTGAALNAAGSSGDPWTTTLPGAYTGSQAGKILSDIVTDTAEIGAAGAGLTAVPWNASWDAQVESEVTDALNAYDPPTNAEMVAAIPTATQNADALLNRDMSAVSDTNARTPLNALRFLRNKYSISGTTLTVTKEDDTTSAWTSALTTNASAEPVTGSDPA